MTENTNLVQLKLAADAILQNEVEDRHSLFQLQCFVLAKEPTIQGKLHQCLREIKSRKRDLDAVALEIEDQKDKIELLDLDIADFAEKKVKGRNEARKAIKIKSIERQIKSTSSHIKQLEQKEKDISVEMQFFCAVFDQLSKREKLKPWDDEEVQKAYWGEKLRFEVNTRLLLRQLPDTELMKTILCLNDDSPIKKSVVEMLNRVNQQPALPQK